MSCAAADAEGIAKLQTLVAAGYFNINGNFASGGSVTLATPACITVESYSVDTSALTFTITGTNVVGAALTESIHGSGATTTTTQTFATVTSVYVNGAVSGNTSIGTSDISYGQWVPLDTYMTDFQTSYYVTSTSSNPSWSIEVTFDDVFGTWRPSSIPFPRAVSVPATATSGNGNGVINDSVGPVTAVRLSVDSTGTAATLNATFIQQGY